jgi:hypothetical protein
MCPPAHPPCLGRRDAELLALLAECALRLAPLMGVRPGGSVGSGARAAAAEAAAGGPPAAARGAFPAAGQVEGSTAQASGVRKYVAGVLLPLAKLGCLPHGPGGMDDGGAAWLRQVRGETRGPVRRLEGLWRAGWGVESGG